MTRRWTRQTLKLRQALRKDDPARVLEEEMAFHVEMRTRDYMKAGMSREEAHRAAAKRFGDMNEVRLEAAPLAIEVDARDRRTEWLADALHDLRYALRVLTRSPGYVAVAMCTLGIGIGAASAIFSVVDAVLVRGLPYAHAARLVAFGNATNGSDGYTSLSAAEFADMQESVRSLDGLAALRALDGPLAGGCGTDDPRCSAELAHGYGVSPNLFSLLGTTPVLGRALVPSDGHPGAPLVTVIAHDLWQRRYGGDTTVLGTTILFNGQAREVVGVMPRAVRFPDAPLGAGRERADLWVPVAWENHRSEGRGNQYLVVIGRLAPGASRATLDAEVASIERRFKAAWPERYADPALGWRIAVMSLTEELLGDVRAPLLYIGAAIALLLLIACVNVANLMLVRGARQRGELAVRAALGAGRQRLARLLFAECAIIALGAGVLGIAAAFALVPVLLRLDPTALPLADAVAVDARVAGFALILSILIAFACGLWPALEQSRLSLASSMRSGAGSASFVLRGGMRRAVILCQVALATVLLVTASLLGRSFKALHDVDVGVTNAGRLTFDLSLPGATYDSTHKVVALLEAAQSALAAIPGVTGVSAVYPLPLSGSHWSGTYHVEGQPSQRPADLPHGELAVALPGYAAVHGATLLAGRDFTTGDRLGAPPVAVVDDRLARLHWPDRDPVGQRISIAGPNGPWMTVIGVITHIRRGGPLVAGEPQLFMPALQRGDRTLSFVLRGGSRNVAAEVRRVVAQLDPALPVPVVEPAQAVVNRAFARQRLSAGLFAAFGFIAATLIGVGLYAVMSFLVASRTREMGVRLAVGGTPSSLRRLILGEAFVTTLAGVCLGLLLSALTGPWLGSWLYGISPVDPVTYLSIALGVGGIGAAAALVPARRATATDPMRALRT